MKVLHISYAMNWGGGEQQMVNLIKGIGRLGVENLVICIKNSALEKYLLSNNIETVSIVRKKGFNILYLKKLNLRMTNFGPDVLHIHTGSFLKDFLWISKILKLKYNVVYTMNGMIRKKSFLSKIKYNNSKIDTYYCISKSVENNLKQNVLYPKYYSKTSVVYDGISLEKANNSNREYVDIRKKLSLKSEAKIVANIANHTDAKDLMTFFKTADFLINNKKDKDLIFVQIGRESKRTQEFKEFVKSNKLSDRIYILGFIENAREYLHSFDCFLMTSNREGLSMSILESFLYKIPVVSTKAGGVPEAVIHEETGLLVDIGDYKTLAKQVSRIFLEDELRERIVSNAYKKLLNNFTTEILAEKTLKLYTQVINEH